MSPDATPKAYSYVRFSTPEQAKGDSFARQTSMAEAYAARHGLELDDKLTFQDLGVSAFRGQNSKTGALRAFLRKVEDGDIATGSILLVENMDRLSRATILEAQHTFTGIIHAGIKLVTLADGRSYSRESITANPFDLILSLVMMIRGNDESETKAKRLRAAWTSKRARIETQPLTSRAPAWLRLDRTTKRFEVIPERAQVILRIYSMAAQGIGQHSIAETLNAEEVPTFGDGTRKAAAFWHKSYVTKVLRSDAPGGSFTPHRLEHVDGKKVRVPEAKVEGYFPAVVPPELVAAVRTLQTGQGNPRHRGSAPKPISTFLAGVMRCGLCGSAMHRVNKGAKGARPYVVCSRARMKATNPRCTMPAMQLFPWEYSVATYFAEDTRDVPLGDDETLAAELAAAKQTMTSSELAMDALVDVLEGREASPRLLKRFRQREADFIAASKLVAELERKLVALESKEVVRNVAELERFFQEAVNGWTSQTPKALESFDHVKASALVRRAVHSVTLHWGPASVGDPRGPSFEVQWRHGPLGGAGVYHFWGMGN